MDERPQHRSRSSQVARRRTLGEDLQRIAECFEDDCALGVLLIDASGLAPIEPHYGGDALHHAMGNLGDMIQAMVGDRLSVNDAVLIGEVGRDEIAVFLFRGVDETTSSSASSDKIRRDVTADLAQRGQPRRLSVHAPAAALPRRHGHRCCAIPRSAPSCRSARRSRSAREHIDLVARLESRRRRKQIFELVLERQIYSVVRADRRGQLAHRVRLRGARARTRRHRPALARHAVHARDRARSRVPARLPVPAERPRRRARPAPAARSCS
jgi:hypothetical protein